MSLIPIPRNRGRELTRPTGSTLSDDLRYTSYFFYLFTLVGAGILWMHAGSWKVAATPLLWALSCLASGAAIGFLFGIPKILQSDNSTDAESNTAIAYRQQVNTNLEQISDWLTKIIVGLGLVQLRNMPEYLSRTAATLAASMGAAKDNIAFTSALIIYFSLVGFLFGYLTTRLFLAGAFARADQTATAIAIFEKIKSLAVRLEPDLLKQVILNSSAEAIIRGEVTSQDADEESDTTESPEELELALAQVKKQ